MNVPLRKLRFPLEWGAFVAFVLVAAVLTVCTALAAHLGFAVLKSTPLAALARYEGAFQELLFAVFAGGILAVHAVRTVKIDLQLLKRDSRGRQARRPAPPLSLGGNRVVRRGVY